MYYVILISIFFFIDIFEFILLCNYVIRKTDLLCFPRVVFQGNMIIDFVLEIREISVNVLS